MWPEQLRAASRNGERHEAPPGRQPSGATIYGSAPDRIRTCDLMLRRHALYPAELRARCSRQTRARRDAQDRRLPARVKAIDSKARFTTGKLRARHQRGDGRGTRKSARISRVLSPHARAAEEDHSSGPAVASDLERPTRDSDGAGNPSSPTWPCSGWGLPCDLCYQRPGALLPHPFTLT